MPRVTNVEVRENAVRVSFGPRSFTIPTGEVHNPDLCAQVNKLIAKWAPALGIKAVGAAKKREVLLRIRCDVELPLD